MSDQQSSLEAAQSLIQQLFSNPKTRKDALRLVKTLQPDAVIPELDEPDRIEAMLAERDKKIDGLEQEMQKREVESSLEKDRVKTQSKFGFSEEQMAEIEKIMSEKKIGDLETASEYYQAMQKPAEPAFSSRQLDMPKIPLGDFANIDVWARNEAELALHELQQRRRNGAN